MNLRHSIAIAAGKLAGALSRRFGAGGGTALPGLVASSLDPGLLQHLLQQVPQGSVMVTGTNGKTTTSRMLSAILQAGGFIPLQNRTGSNLLRGLTTALLAQTGPSGRLKAEARTIGVFEVDEAVLPLAIAVTRPRVVLITNLFRDQLDRYGEVDSVRGLWREAVSSLPRDTTIVLNADDPAVATLGDCAGGAVLFFGVEDLRLGGPDLEHAADSLYCLNCGRPYDYAVAFYAHLGHYRCTNCGTARPAPQVAAGRIAFQSPDRTQVELSTTRGQAAVSLSLGGLYNVYNALGAAAAGLALGVPMPVIGEALAGLSPAFGRMERLDIEGRRVCLILVKNPTGFNQVLRTLGHGARPHTILMVLNDQIADGRDVSWIWDVDFEALAVPKPHAVGTIHGSPLQVASSPVAPLRDTSEPVGEAREPPLHEGPQHGPPLQAAPVDGPSVTPPLLVASGLRAEDLALRLRYAGLGVSQDFVVRELSSALDLAVRGTPIGETLYILPTYTAMLSMQRLLARRGHLGHYWEER